MHIVLTEQVAFGWASNPLNSQRKKSTFNEKFYACRLEKYYKKKTYLLICFTLYTQIK